ncbi:MAG TPA: hypothetical protein VML19_07950 [Verrucomicrobiae bacterium]|nr:hypothetical protein [Verrucomicrobiae bacterium]
MAVRLRRVCTILLALLAAASPVLSQPAVGSRDLCSQVPAIAQTLTKISGMKLLHPVPCAFITKEKINQFLKQRVHEDENPEDIRDEELVLKRFGFVPQDYNLADSTVDLLTEQAAAFYDYNKKKLFITETTPSDTQDMVLAHELSHALADQSFHLARYIRQGRKSDDGSTARLAVMEGQATWLMSEYLAEKAGKSLKDTPEMVAMMASDTENSGSGDYPVFENAPLYLRQTLVFPYTKGMLFQNAVLQRDGEDGFAEVFRRAPVSTQQILHPEKYFAKVDPTDPELPNPHLPSSYKPLIGGSLGELEHTILLEQYAGKETAHDLAPHWRGCNFEMREDRKAKRDVLLYAVEWDSAENARQYFAAYRKALEKRWKSFKVASETRDSVSGDGDFGGFELKLNGTIVTSVEGFPPR